MFDHSRGLTRTATIDLETVRDTIAYIHDDLERVPGLEKAVAALDAALREIERWVPPHHTSVALRPARHSSRFLARKG